MQGAGDEMSKSIGCKLQCSIGATALNHFATVRIADFNEKMGKKQVSIGWTSTLKERKLERVIFLHNFIERLNSSGHQIVCIYGSLIGPLLVVKTGAM